MRFVWAVVAFVLAVVCVGASIAQRTVLLGPNTHTEQLAVDKSQAYTVVDAKVLSFLPGGQQLKIKGDGALFAAYGRTSDVTAWVSDASYNQVTVTKGKEKNSPKVISSTVVEPKVAATSGATQSGDQSAQAGDAVTPAETGGRNPAGSDLWIMEYSGNGTLDPVFNLPADMSLIIATDGKAPAPADISVQWSIDNSTPWAGPLIVIGAIFMLIGLVLWVLGFRHLRRKRGPRRRGLPPLPETQPLSLEEVKEAEANGVISTTEKSAAKSRGRRRTFAVVPVAILSAVALAGCSPDVWPKVSEPTPTPSPTASVIAPEGQKSPVLLESQATRVLERISETAASADTAKDVSAAATRLDGPVLAARETNYKLRSAIADYASPAAVPANWTILLPQAADTWPRSFLAIYKDDKNSTVPPVIMTVTQHDPWSAYKLEYAAQMEAGTEVPFLAPPNIGATRVNPDNAFLRVAPEKLAGMYADIIANGDKSTYAPMFDLASDKFRPQLMTKRTDALATFNKDGKVTGELTFGAEAGPAAPVALATLDSGAIVSVTVRDTELPKQTIAGGVIRVGNDPVVKTLTGVTESAKGFITTYETQMFFYVPAQGSNDLVRLLGYSSNVLKAEVMP